jgi:exopolysaccharide biosynthesis polyprenyl glycosylphosphotransferase
MKNPFKQYSPDTIYLFITDWLILTGTFGMALACRCYAPEMDIISRTHVIPEALFVFVYAVFQLGTFGALNLYKRKVLLNKLWHLTRIAAGTLFCILFYLLLRTLSQSPALVSSRYVLMNWGLLLFSALAIHRMLIFPALLRAATRAQLQRRVVIIGTEQPGIEFARKCLAKHDYDTLRPIGFICDHRPAGEPVFENLCCLGRPEDIEAMAESCRIEGAVITQTGLSYQQLMDLIERCVRLFGWVDVHTDKVAVLQETLDADTYFKMPFVRLGEVRRGFFIRAYKRIFDALGAAAGVVLLSPLLLAAALAIKLTSPGPVFYIRERVGKDGKRFRFYKFRSMVTDADQDKTREEDIFSFIHEENGTPLSKLVNEAYVTPVGKFIRKWAIDELPQLFNVLKGDMSLIGPRPALVSEYEVYDEWQKKRFEIQPGCSGLWKLYAARHEGTAFAHIVLYDLYYARNINPLLDLYIVFMTVWLIITGKVDG